MADIDHGVEGGSSNQANVEESAAAGPSSAKSRKNVSTPTASKPAGVAGSISRSRFGFVRSEVFHAVSWQNPVLSGFLFSGGLAFFLAHWAIGYAIPAIVAHLIVLGLFVSAAVHIHNSFQTAQPLPQLRVPLDRGAVSELGVLAADRVNRWVERANGLLTWSDPAASGRALAYAWLAARFSFLFTPSYLFMGFVLAFALAPAYLQMQPTVDSLYETQVIPYVKQASVLVNTVEARVRAFVEVNKVPALVGGGIFVLLFVYTFWNYISLCGLCTFAAMHLPMYDALKAVSSSDARNKRE